MSDVQSACRECHATLTQRFCSACGLDSQCAQCGATLTASFCGQCGMSVAGATPTQFLPENTQAVTRKRTLIIGSIAGAVVVVAAVVAGVLVGGSSGSSNNAASVETPKTVTSQQPGTSSPTTIATTTSTTESKASGKPIYDSVTRREVGDPGLLAQIRPVFPVGGDNIVCSWDCGVYAAHQSWAVDEWFTYCGIGTSGATSLVATVRGRKLAWGDPTSSDTAVPYVFVLPDAAGANKFVLEVKDKQSCIADLAKVQTQRDVQLAGIADPKSVTTSVTWFPSLTVYSTPAARLAITGGAKLINGQTVQAADVLDLAVSGRIVMMVDITSGSNDFLNGFGNGVMQHMIG